METDFTSPTPDVSSTPDVIFPTDNIAFENPVYDLVHQPEGEAVKPAEPVYYSSAKDNVVVPVEDDGYAELNTEAIAPMEVSTSGVSCPEELISVDYVNIAEKNNWVRDFDEVKDDRRRSGNLKEEKRNVAADVSINKIIEEVLASEGIGERLNEVAQPTKETVKDFEDPVVVAPISVPLPTSEVESIEKVGDERVGDEGVGDEGVGDEAGEAAAVEEERDAVVKKGWVTDFDSCY